jgi:N-acetylglutamate synthase-like GNAT family acetyltransferase
MQNINIVPAQESDWPYIKEKLQKYALDETDAQWHHFFVAKINGETKGFARIVDRGDYVELASLGVDYYSRGQGIGKKLLEFIIKEAKISYPGKDIYGVTHRPGFLRPFGFKEIEKAPQALIYKKYHQCILDSSKIKIMRLVGRERWLSG